MNKYYVIVPVILLVVFGVLYRGALHDMEAKEATRQQAIATAKAAEDARQKEIERKAAEDAEKRQKEREAADKAKEEKREKEYQDAMKKLKDEADGYAAETDKLVKENNELEIQLANLRTEKENTNTEVFSLAKKVELGKVARRNADLELQRVLEMIGSKVGASSIAQIPPPPPEKK